MPIHTAAPEGAGRAWRIILFNIIYQSLRRHQVTAVALPFNILYQSPRRHLRVQGGPGGSSFLISFTNPHGGTVPTNIRRGRAKYISSLILSYRVFFLTTNLTIRIISAKSPASQRPGLEFGSIAAILFLSLSPGGLLLRGPTWQSFLILYYRLQQTIYQSPRRHQSLYAGSNKLYTNPF